MTCGRAGRGRTNLMQRIAATAALAALTALAAAAAQPGQTGATDEDLQRLVGLLNSPKHEVRNEATLALKIEERFTLERLEQALRRPGLTPEQRQRLLDIHLARFERTPRAAMGVQFDYTLPQRVIIQRTYEPFPASRVLRPGDMITAADGVRLHGLDAAVTMRSIILSHDPGDEVPIVVQRGAERLDLTIRLGRWADFQGPARSTPVASDIRAAWLIRIERALRDVPGPASEPISTGLTAAEWAEMERSAQIRRGTRQAELIQSGQATVTPRLLLAGGRPRNDMPDEFDRQRAELNGKDELSALQWQQRMRQQGELRPRIGVPETPDLEIERLRQRAAMVRREIDQANNDGDLQLGREQVLAEFQRELALIEQLMEAVRADAALAEQR